MGNICDLSSALVVCTASKGNMFANYGPTAPLEKCSIHKIILFYSKAWYDNMTLRRYDTV